MKHYNHYSFDLWLTLIKSNPEFKHERARYFYKKKYNPNDFSVDQIKILISEIDVMCNEVNEIVGKSIDALEMYAIVLRKLGVSANLVNYHNMLKLYADIEEIFMKYPPVFYDEHTIPTIAQLAVKSNLSILSNTGFIKGSTLRKFLRSSGLDLYFEFMLFSDEEDLSKPNPVFFMKVIQSIYEKNLYEYNSVRKYNILHVGDNQKADYSVYMSEHHPLMSFQQINSSDIRIQSLLL